MEEAVGHAQGASGQLRAGDLHIDLGRKRVVRRDVELPLPRLSFDLLVVLAESAPDYVSNDQLLARVWPGIVVADKTITQRVKLLREALGDDPRHPRYIAGLRGRGYRLVPDLVRVEPPAAAAGAGVPVAGRGAALRTASVRVSRTGRRWLAAAIAASLIVVVTSGFFATRWGSAPPRSRLALAADAGQVRPASTVAVLPFRDLSGAADDAYLALGIPEAVLDQLSRIPGLTVIARNSSFKAAGEGLDERELGERLGARLLIDGSVQRAGDQLRVSASLTDAWTATRLWTRRFDRPIDDVFAIQDELALDVAGALQARVAESATSLSAAPATRNTAAYLAYLEGRTQIARWTIADAQAAERSFRRAIEFDPNFAAAHAALYDARLMLAERRQGGAAMGPFRPRSWGPGRRLEQERNENQGLLDRALELDPSSGAAYFARATWADLSDVNREADFRKALTLDPGNARGITAFAEFLDTLGRAEEARALLERAVELDPLSPRSRFWLVMRDWQNNATQLEDQMRAILELDPDYQPALQRYAKFRWFLHAEFAEAIQLIERALASDPDNPWLLHTAVAIYLDAGDPAAARELVESGGAPEVSGLMLLRLYEGDRDGAAELAFSDAAFAHGPFENWGVYEGVRDWALHTREYARGIEYLREHAEVDLDDPVVTPINFRSMPALSELLLAAGSTRQANLLIERSLQWIDAVHLARIGKAWALRARANLLRLQGKDDAALETLQLAFEAPDYQQWWYTLERDPLWAPLRGDPRFSAISTAVRARVEAQAVALGALRAQGLVPRRAAATTGALARNGTEHVR